jgi:hypothetical protein
MEQAKGGVGRQREEMLLVVTEAFFLCVCAVGVES